jgi:hypothetical protein
MLLERKQDLSVYFWLRNQFSASPFINIVDGFPEDDLVIPTIALDEDISSSRIFEMGDRNRIKTRYYYFEVFAANKTQRNEMGYTLLNALEEKIPVYDYDEGISFTTTPSQIGVLDPEEIVLKPIKVIPELTENLYYRATVSFVAEYQQI